MKEATILTIIAAVCAAQSEPTCLTQVCAVIAAVAAVCCFVRKEKQVTNNKETK